MTVFYFPIEAYKERYTKQLCEEWVPNAFKGLRQVLHPVVPPERQLRSEIKTGSVLDAAGRSVFSLQQCAEMCKLIDNGEVQKDDILLLQDYWTPGIEGVLYTLQMHGLYPKVFAMLHAQSVDPYDFTSAMLPWIRPYELGLDSWMAVHGGAIFVASTIHKQELRAAGFGAKIHVVSLPLDKRAVLGGADFSSYPAKEKMVVYTSRLNEEKRPGLMLRIARRFCLKYPDWKFVVTTSASAFSPPKSVEAQLAAMAEIPNFSMRVGLTKGQYYSTLAAAAIILNTSLQDYVSWTLLEAAACGCDLCYPDFRSFKECVPAHRRYSDSAEQGDACESALMVLEDCMQNPQTHTEIADLADKGRRLMAWAVCNSPSVEINLWQGNAVV